MKTLFLTALILPAMALAAEQAAAPQPAPAEVIAALPDEAPVVAPKVTEAPEWLVKAMDVVSSVPVVGPVVVEVAKWLGVIASILTILVTAILAAIKALSLVLPAVRLASLAAWLVKLEGSTVMFWLKFFSMYNAKREEKKADSQPKQ